MVSPGEPAAAHPFSERQRTIALRVQYDGTDFHGFQKQTHRRTVQGELESALAKLCGEVRTHGAGRTDAGVHATGQVVSFATASRIPVDRWPMALNSRLPRDVAVTGAWEAPAGFHARYSALARRYRYTLLCGGGRHVLAERYAWLLPGNLSDEAMNEGAEVLVGTHDFRAFGRVEPGEPTTRHLSVLTLARKGRELQVIIEANAFLRGMARCLVAALVLVGRREWSIGRLEEMLQSGLRPAGFRSAPPQGLCLVKVCY